MLGGCLLLFPAEIGCKEATGEIQENAEYLPSGSLIPTAGYLLIYGRNTNQVGCTIAIRWW